MSSEEDIIGYQGDRKKVLVVDDVVLNRLVMVDMLSALGFQTTEAENGSEGITMAQIHSPDLILMDNVMPVMNGLDATRHLRELPRFQDTPIIIASASASDKDQELSRTAGANTFIPKPVDLQNLVRQIGMLLRLTWIYELREDVVYENSSSFKTFALPPPNEMEMLHKLAMTGNMRDIRERAAYLISIDERYRPLANKLSSLAEGFQSDAILQLVEKWIEK